MKGIDARRKAGQIWNAYNQSSVARNLGETLGVGAVTATGQLLMSDMTIPEILASTGIGAVAATAAREPAAYLGSRLGRALSKRHPHIERHIPLELAHMFAGPSRRGRVSRESLYSQFGPGAKAYYKAVKEPQLLGRYKNDYLNADGSRKPFLEGALGSTGRYYGDNIAQYLVGFASPLILSKLEGETETL